MASAARPRVRRDGEKVASVCCEEVCDCWDVGVGEWLVRMC